MHFYRAQHTTMWYAVHIDYPPPKKGLLPSAWGGDLLSFSGMSFIFVQKTYMTQYAEYLHR